MPNHYQACFRFLAVVVAFWSTASFAQTSQRPNILFMLTDDQPQNCLGIMGNESILTPHLDRLARRGTLFNNAFVTTAICCSNRACILTGQHMYRHGISDFKTPLTAKAIDQTYPALLRRSGYRTGYLGKFAVGNPAANNRELSLPHGSLLGDHGLSGKWLMYENSIRVPLIIYDPRVNTEQAGHQRDEIALSIDLAPTMLALAGIEVPDSMQGKNLMPIVNQQPIEWRSHFYYQHTYDTDPPRSPIAQSEGVRTQRWKYVRYPKTDPVFEQLFDLEADPLEQTNLASRAEHSIILSKLRTMCDQDPKLP